VNVSSCTALSEQMSDIADVNIYPNPNDGRFYIETNILATYKIYDQLGILVQFGKVSSQKQYIDLSAFASGVYFVQFIEENNVRIVKLVKTD
jgi:glucuronoarabinoxylan endo-1,4-beta-xylanase